LRDDEGRGGREVAGDAHSNGAIRSTGQTLISLPKRGDPHAEVGEHPLV